MRRSLTVLTVLTVLVLAGSALSLWLALTRPAPVQTDQPAALEGPGGAALLAAVDTVPEALAYDYRDLPAGLAAATSGMTDRFAREFAATFRRSVASTAQERKAVTDAVVRGAGLVEVAGDRALCLLFVDQRLRASDAADGESRPASVARIRVHAELRLRDGEWKVSDLSAL